MHICFIFFKYMYRASFFILYNDQQMRNSLTNYPPLLHVSTLSRHPQWVCS